MHFLSNFCRASKPVAERYDGVPERATDPSSDWRTASAWEYSRSSPPGRVRRMVPADVRHQGTCSSRRGSTHWWATRVEHLDWVIV